MAELHSIHRVDGRRHITHTHMDIYYNKDDVA